MTTESILLYPNSKSNELELNFNNNATLLDVFAVAL